ncbi:MAG: hypothetical protein DI592_17840, partial [Stenotrophomonas maltophilia]
MSQQPIDHPLLDEIRDRASAGRGKIFNILQWATSPISHLGLSTEEEVSLAARLHPLLLEAESGGQDVLDLVQDDDNLALIFIVLEMALEK